MSDQVNKEKPRRMRLVSGSVDEVERGVNELLDSYAPMTWNYTVVDGELIVTVLLIHESELRKAAMMQTAGMMPLRRPGS